jgi:hypothetical protein
MVTNLTNVKVILHGKIFEFIQIILFKFLILNIEMNSDIILIDRTIVVSLINVKSVTSYVGIYFRFLLLINFI